MSFSALLAQHNDLMVLDINIPRVDKINNKQSTFADAKMSYF
jgi:hypothetical protein